MAIYHLSAHVISRGRGQSAVAAAAYRAACVLRDQRYGTTHNYTHRRDVYCAEILSPDAAPAWVRDREVLWNRVEAAELRKDSQLARAIEVSLPLELSAAECALLVREYVAREFVALGMVADFSVYQGPNPKAHILLTLRPMTASGFAAKERRWNGRAKLFEWRAAWADLVNEHLARAGQAVRVDHRTLAAQQIELVPSRNLGAARSPRTAPDHLAERLAEHNRIAHDNGSTILADPAVLLRALTRQRPTFTRREMADFLRTRCHVSQFDAALGAVEASAELVALNDGAAEPRFTSRDMLDAAKSLRQRAIAMSGRKGHSVAVEHRQAALTRHPVNAEQRLAWDYLVGDGDAKAIVMTSADKHVVLAAARLAWEAQGLRCIGAARSAADAEALRSATGIDSRSFETHEKAWLEGRDSPGRETVLIADAADTLGLKELERLLAVADRVRAMTVLCGDSARLAAMKAEAPFRVLWRIVGMPESSFGF